MPPVKWTYAERLRISDFIDCVIEDYFPFCEQEACMTHGWPWCADWWTVEGARFMLLGPENYYPQTFLRGNPSVSLVNLEVFREPKALLMDVLKSIPGDIDIMLDCEVCRGFEILLASMVRPFKKYFCYDNNEAYGPWIEKYFVRKLGLDVEFVKSSSYEYPFDTFSHNPSILVMGRNICGKPEVDKIFGNKSFKHVVHEGHIVRTSEEWFQY